MALQDVIAALQREREEKLADIAKIDRALRELGADAGCAQDFRGCGIVDATKRWLEEQGAPRSTTEIANAIRARGVETKSRKFTATLYATLKNAIDAGDRDLVRQGRFWALRMFTV